MNQHDIGLFIASKRRKQNLTQEQLAEKIGVSNKTVSKWETGKTMPDYSVVELLCQVLNISVGELIAGKEPDANKSSYEEDMALLSYKIEQLENHKKSQIEASKNGNIIRQCSCDCYQLYTVALNRVGNSSRFDELGICNLLPDQILTNSNLSVNFEKILKFADARYVYGLTATPSRQDGQHPIMFMQCGPIRYRVDAKAQAEKREFEHYLIPRFTSYRSLDADKGIAEIYRNLAENEIRNSMIVRDVVKSLQQGRCPIILTERREHVFLLQERLSGHCKNIITLFGTASQKECRETLQRLESIPSDESLLIIATGKYVGEGFDYPRLDTLFLALPIAWKGKVAQYAGRLHRNYLGKTEVQIYDYVDIHIPVLERMYQKRVKGYAAIGYKIKIDPAPRTEPDLIYDGKTFYGPYCQDIRTAAKEILIVSPFMRKGRITQLMQCLTEAILNGAFVTVVTRPPEDFKEKDRETVENNISMLQDYGIKVVTKSGFHQKFTVIDGEVVWYGSVNFLSFGISEESIMRFTNADIAGQLIDTVQ